MSGRALLLAAAAAALALPAMAAPPARRAAPAPARTDWSRTVVATPEGGFRMGNPNARVKLVEYGSLTCPHCATFSKVGMAPLIANYVRGGRLSYEYRNYVLNGIDVAATLVARCGGPGRFFALADRFYATQTQWVGRVSGLSQAQKDQLKALPEGQRLGRIADLAGLTQMAAQLGVAPAQSKRCLADPAALERLGKIYDAASSLGVEGTPTFFINGANIGTHNWPSLEPILRDAAG